MDTKTPARPQLKHALTATAFAIVTTRNAWREYFRGVMAERRRLAAEQRRGW